MSVVEGSFAKILVRELVKHSDRTYKELRAMPKVFYRKGYKYQLAKSYSTYLPFAPEVTIETEFISFTSRTGLLQIKAGYAWDGASGPTIDTESAIEGSLAHDALYQLIRQKYLGKEFRPLADEALRDICITNGMYKWRASLWYRAVRKAAACAASPDNVKKVYVTKSGSI
jgi:hypothetical protein